MQKQTKIIIVVLLAVVVVPILLCCSCGGFASIVGVKTLSDSYQPIANEVLTPACELVEEGADEGYDDLFTEDYKSTHTLTEARMELAKAMPTANCDYFDQDGVWDLLSSGLTLTVNSGNGVDKATLSYSIASKDGKESVVVLNLEKEDGRWKIDDIDVD